VNENPFAEFERQARRIINEEMLKDPRAKMKGTRQYFDERCTAVIEEGKSVASDTNDVKCELALYWLGYPVGWSTFWLRLKWLCRAAGWLLRGEAGRHGRRP
jgi:hypothetical protein